jgi:hypothetical protein
LAVSVEAFDYASFGLMSGRRKRVHSRSKAPASWVTYQGNLPSPGVESDTGLGEQNYSSASDNTFSESLVLIRTEQERFTYRGHPYEVDQVYLWRREGEQRGLITRDSDNPQLDQDFDQPLEVAQRSGNLAEGQGSYWGLAGYRWEEQVPQRNRGVLIRSSDMDTLNTSDGEALLPADWEDPRQGDIGISVIQHIQKQVYVFDEADSTATKILSLNAGEAPLANARPLAVRYNRAQFYPGSAQMSIPGFDNGIVRGRTIAPSDRSGTSFGTYRITGFTITGGGGKYQTAIRAKQIGSAEVVAAASTQVNDVFSVSLESGQQRTATIQVPCWNGMFLSGEVVSDLMVEARIGHTGAFTDIETVSIDLAAYDGTTQEVEVRMTAPTVTSHYVRSFRLRTGPPSTTQNVYYGAELVTYNGEQVTYTH